MSGSFFSGDDVIYVSNRRLTSLVEFGLEVAATTAETPDQRVFVERFKSQALSFFPGIDVDLDDLFPTASERAFWAATFSELSARIELGEIGNADSADWRSSGALDALRIADMLRAAPVTHDVCARIREARGDDAIVRIENVAVSSAGEAAGLFGLATAPWIYREVSREEARAVLLCVLEKDMAYRCELMPADAAASLADAFLSSFDAARARHFSNGDIALRARAKGHGQGWHPATDATFDSGVLVLDADRVGCAWFMDED